MCLPLESVLVEHHGLLSGSVSDVHLAYVTSRNLNGNTHDVPALAPRSPARSHPGGIAGTLGVGTGGVGCVGIGGTGAGIGPTGFHSLTPLHLLTTRFTVRHISFLRYLVLNWYSPFSNPLP